MWAIYKLNEILIGIPNASGPIIEEYTAARQRLWLTSEKELKALSSLYACGIHVLYAGKTPDLQIVAKDPDDDKFV